MKNYRKLALLTLLSGVISVSAFSEHEAQAQPPQLPEPLYARDFENGVGEWVVIGEKGKISPAREGTKVGTGALQFDYEVANGGYNALAAPMATGALSSLKTLTMTLKSDHDTPLIVALNEQGGGRFVVPVSLVSNRWQPVELKVEDFRLQTGPDDPKDANGKLDLEKIDALAFLDFNQLFVQGDVNSPIARLLDIASGPRVLWVDDVRLSSKPLPEAPQTEVAKDAISIDQFLSPQVSWLGMGNIALERAKAELPENNALQAKYQQAPARISAMIKPLTTGILAGKKQLSFQIASEKPAVLIVQLEEESGGKYNFTTLVAGDVKPKMVDADFADFKPSDDSKDNNNQLDLDQVKQIFVMDAAGLIGQGKGDNTLWLGRIIAK